MTFRCYIAFGRRRNIADCGYKYHLRFWSRRHKIPCRRHALSNMADRGYESLWPNMENLSQLAHQSDVHEIQMMVLPLFEQHSTAPYYLILRVRLKKDSHFASDVIQAGYVDASDARPYGRDRAEDQALSDRSDRRRMGQSGAAVAAAIEARPSARGRSARDHERDSLS